MSKIKLISPLTCRKYKLPSNFGERDRKCETLGGGKKRCCKSSEFLLFTFIVSIQIKDDKMKRTGIKRDKHIEIGLEDLESRETIWYSYLGRRINLQ